MGLGRWTSIESTSAPCVENGDPTGQTMLLRRWINVIDVDSTSQQRRVSSA